MNNQSQVQFGPALVSWEVQSTAITDQMESQQRNHPPSAADEKATGFLQENEVMVYQTHPPACCSWVPSQAAVKLTRL